MSYHFFLFLLTIYLGLLKKVWSSIEISDFVLALLKDVELIFTNNKFTVSV